MPIPPVRGRRGRPRRRPLTLYADRGYDHDKYRKLVRDNGITPHIARRGEAHGSGLGTHRWVVEQTIALLHWFRRLRIRWEIRDDIHEAFLSLASAIICYRRHQMTIPLGILSPYARSAIGQEPHDPRATRPLAVRGSSLERRGLGTGPYLMRQAGRRPRTAEGPVPGRGRDR